VKTGELFVEQVLIGFVMLAAVAVPWAPEVLALARRPEPFFGVVVGAALLGLAYLIGILGDRVADTLTEGLERHQRLRFALTRRLAERGSAARLSPPRERAWDDPFPEDRLRLAVLRDAAPVVQWLDYHRSRVRITRALAVWLPALTLSAVIASARLSPNSGIAATHAWLVVTVAVYVAAAARVAFPGRHASKRRAPRTDSPEAYDYGVSNGFADDGTASRERRRRTLRLIVLDDPAVRGGLVLHGLALALSFLPPFQTTMVGVAVTGAALGILSSWTWWRISWTFRTYLLEAGRRRPEQMGA
jgi:hypothetical protein